MSGFHTAASLTVSNREPLLQQQRISILPNVHIVRLALARLTVPVDPSLNDRSLVLRLGTRQGPTSGEAGGFVLHGPLEDLRRRAL